MGVNVKATNENVAKRFMKRSMMTIERCLGKGPESTRGRWVWRSGGLESKLARMVDPGEVAEKGEERVGRGLTGSL